MTRRALPFLAVAAALTCAALLVPGASGLVDPALAAEAGTLGAEMARIVHARPLAGARTSILVLDAVTGRELFAHNAHLSLKPASNMKVMTAAAALALLRPEYRFRTRFYSHAPPEPDGTVRGDFFVQGGGSPDLVGKQWWAIARRLRALGVKRIEGGLIGDDSFFDAQRRGRRWPSRKNDRPYNAPVSALSCFYSAVAVTVRPTGEGEPPEVFLEPFKSYFRVVNKAITSGSGRKIRVSRLYEDGRNVLLVEGRIGRYAEPVTTYKNVENPTLYALEAFREAAAKEGITIAGASRRGDIPIAAHLVHVHESKPLADLIYDMNKMSNNFMAESILKTIGAELHGAPGSTEKGARAVMNWLAGQGVQPEGLVIADGSGLSVENRLTAGALARVLATTHKDFHAAPEFMASLPVGGIDGTLDRRMNDGAATRNIRAKTGRISGVATLAGYAWNNEGRLLVFAILVNGAGEHEWEITRQMDRLCSTMVTARLPETRRQSPPPASQGG